MLIPDPVLTSEETQGVVEKAMTFCAPTAMPLM